MANPHDSPDTKSVEPSAAQNVGCLSILIRLYWAFFGLACFAMCSAFMLLGYKRESSGWLEGMLIFFAISIVCVRFIDIRYFNGKNSKNEPATMRDLGILGAAIGLATVVVLVLAAFVL